MPISTEEYNALRSQIDAFERARDRLFPGKCSFNVNESLQILKKSRLSRPPENGERSAVEVYEFVRDKPDVYFLYVSESKAAATTFTGDRLGVVSFGREYRDNFGGRRVPVTVTAITGEVYHGTYYKSAGDYARIKKAKK